MKPRSQAFDFLCGICIIRMMMRHAMDTCQLGDGELWSTILHWSFFFMSFFFFKAGYFNKGVQGDSWQFIKKKSKQLMVPYFVWGIVGSIVYCSFAWFVLDEKNFMVQHMSWEHIWETSGFYGNGPCWFLYSFFMAYLAMHFISKCPPLTLGHFKLHFHWIVLFFPFISYYLYTVDNPLWLNLNNVFWGISLFFLGKAWRWCIENVDRYAMMLASSAMIVGFIVLNALTDGEYDMHTNNWTGDFLITLLKIVLSICGFAGLLLSIKMPKVPVVNYIGKHSMVFFVAHYPLLTFYQMLRSSFVHSLRGHWDDLIILSLLIFVFCFWLVPYVERVPWLSGRFKK